MDGFPQVQAMPVFDPQAVLLLIDGRRGRLFEPFLAQDCTVPIAAAWCGLPSNVMRYWVQRFVQLGLLNPSGARSGRGRLIQTYRSVADAFLLLPPARMSVPNEADFRQQYDPLWSRFVLGAVRTSIEQADVWACLLYRDAAGHTVMENVPRTHLDASAPQEPLIGLNTWATVRLTATEAHALQAELDGVVERFVARARRDADTPRYLVHVGLVKEVDPAPGA